MCQICAFTLVNDITIQNEEKKHFDQPKDSATEKKVQYNSIFRFLPFKGAFW